MLMYRQVDPQRNTTAINADGFPEHIKVGRNLHHPNLDQNINETFLLCIRRNLWPP